MNRIYLDNAATTRVKDEVLAAMLPYFSEIYGNPSSIHAFGRDAKRAIEKARAEVATAIHAEKSEIYFTAGGTEADNWAIKGAAHANAHKGKHIITSQIEHHAVLHACEWLQKHGFTITYLPVDAYGRVSTQSLEEAMQPDTILVSIMAANNEIGTLQPIQELAKIAHAHGALFHTDAVQAVGAIPIDVTVLGVDMLSLSAHKFHGPKGVGALYVCKGVRIEPHQHGGAQERNRRGGTENVPAIIGMGAAITRATADIEGHTAPIIRLRDRLIEGIQANIPEVLLNGHPTERLPNNVNVSVRYIEGEALLLRLDLAGIAGSSGSACTSGSLDPSHVLLAMGLPHEIAHGSLRLTLSEFTTEEEIDRTVQALIGIAQDLRALSPLFAQRKGDEILV